MPGFALTGARAVVATMHGKTPVIAAALAPLGLECTALAGLDTDAFGTFTREIARAGDQQHALIAKARAALDRAPQADFALASEGAFGPHPQVPLVPADLEMVGIVEAASGHCVIGHHLTLDTNYAQADVMTPDAARAFAARIGFPDHGVIVRISAEGPVLAKDLTDYAAFDRAIAAHGAIRLETDMRAHRNPTRMRAIGEGARDLARRLAARCPACATPDYTAHHEGGRPCALCRTPTLVPWRNVTRCRACGHEEIRIIDPDRPADPGQCSECNP